MRTLRPLVASALLFLPSVSLAKPCPDIMLVLDQSLSMQQDPNGHEPTDPAYAGPSKWELLQNVITDVVKQYGDHVPFGLELYSIGNNRVSDDVCYNQTSIAVPLAHDSAGQIITSLKAAKPDADTNTNGAIRRARMDPTLANAKKGNYIILVTDGNPNCGSDLTNADPMSGVIDGTQPGTTVQEIVAASMQSPKVLTYVIGFDGDMGGVNSQNLDDMAFYGLGPGNHNCGHLGESHCYYKAGASFSDFKAVFDKIVSDAGGGEFGGALCDDSCYATGCPAGQICTTEETDPSPHCINDPCMGSKCTGNTYCRLGACVKSCDKGCATGSRCQDGTCVPDLCAKVSCNPGQVCDPGAGKCIDFPCPNCTNGAICDVATGKCLADQCKIITCPKGMSCVPNGNCQAPEGGVSSGCSATGSVAPAMNFDGTLVFAGSALLVALAMMMGRRRAAVRAK